MMVEVKKLEAANLLGEESMRLLGQLPTGRAAAVWKYFCWVMQIPRPSGHLEIMQSKLLELAAELGVESAKDEIGNIVIKKPAGKGYESSDIVCVQCHLDMVASKNDNVNHDFVTEPIRARVDGEWLKSCDTTLGADNGVGIAACLALLEENVCLPALELLFTVEEETTMGGALNLALSPFLKATRLINVDNEDMHVVCIGCAGGFERELNLPVQWAAIDDGTQLVRIEVRGLAGGHTGADIHKGRGNAIQWLARLINAANEVEPCLVALQAGTGVNAIPREATCTVAVANQKATVLQSLIQTEFHALCDEFRFTEPTGSLTMDLVETEHGVQRLTWDSSRKAIDFLLTLPHGPLRMSQSVAGLVESSCALSLAALRSKTFYAHVFFRSSSGSHSKAYGSELDSLARLTGAVISENVNAFPGWNPNIDSPLLRIVLAAHQDLFDKPAKVEGIHAGLECGIIQERYPAMDCVSFGPDIQGAHSPDERLLIGTVEPFYDWLLATLVGCKGQ